MRALPANLISLITLIALSACSRLPNRIADWNYPAAEAVAIPLETYLGQLRKIPVEVDGQSYDFLFDTGGGYTLVSPEISQALDCEPHGIITGFRLSGERVDGPKCGEVSFSVEGEMITTEAGHFDINALLPAHWPELYGLLSLHTFKDRAITLDLARNLLILETPDSLAARVETMQPLDVAFYDEIEGRGMDVYLRVPTPKGHLHLLLDSANLVGNLIHPLAWQELTSADEPPAVDESGELELDLGGTGAVRLSFHAREMIREGALDVNFMESAVFTFDFPGRRAWIRR